MGADWGFDGKSIMPILQGKEWPDRGIGWLFDKWGTESNHGFRFGKWKYVHGSKSCGHADCQGDQLYDLDLDLGERNDLSNQFPEVLEAIKANYTVWYDSVARSRDHESMCGDKPTPAPTPTPPSPPPSHGCDWQMSTGLEGNDLRTVVVASKKDCCDECKATSGCVAADFNNLNSDTYRCHLKDAFNPKSRDDGSIACVPSGLVSV